MGVFYRFRFDLESGLLFSNFVFNNKAKVNKSNG